MGGPPSVTVVMEGGGLDESVAPAMTLLLSVGVVGLFTCGALQIPGDLLYAVPLFMGSLGLSVLAVRRSRRIQRGSVLLWDGHTWFWSQQRSDRVCAIRCIMDLQVCMLLRLQTTEASPEWVWLLRKDHVKNWYPLRRVLIFGAASVHDGAIAVHKE